MACTDFFELFRTYLSTTDKEQPPGHVLPLRPLTSHLEPCPDATHGNMSLHPSPIVFLANFIGDRLVNPAFNDDFMQILTINGAFQTFVEAEKRSNSLLQEEISALRYLLERVTESTWPCRYNIAKAKTAGFILFHDMQAVYFKARWNLTAKLEVACCSLDLYSAIHQSTKLKLQDYLTESSFSDLFKDIICQYSIPVLGDIAYFFNRCIQSGRRNEIIQLFRAEKWDDLQIFLSAFNDTSDPIVHHDFILFLNGLVNYAEDMPTLSSVPASIDFFRDFATWILRNGFDIQSINQRTARTVGFATLLPASCMCISVKKIMLLTLKSCCILARTDGLESILLNNFTPFSDIATKMSCPVHAGRSRPYQLISLFSGDDEDLCCVLLCCLHIFLLSNPKTVSLMDFILTPQDAFNCLLDLISDDHFVIISWLTDSESSFLAYFLQYLKSIENVPVGERQILLFVKIRASLSHLHADGEILFNPTPLLRRLDIVTKK